MAKTLVLSAQTPTPSAKQEGLDWDAVREVFVQHYWVEDKDLPEVMRLMEGTHGFIASKKQYKNQIEKWNLKKNIASDEYRAIVRIRKRRREEEKETFFTVRNRPVPEEKIERFIKRQKGPGSPPPADNVPVSAATPSDVGYCTPASPGGTAGHATPSPGPESPLSVSSPMVQEFGSMHLDVADENKIPPIGLPPSVAAAAVDHAADLPDLPPSALPMSQPHQTSGATVTVQFQERLELTHGNLHGFHPPMSLDWDPNLAIDTLGLGDVFALDDSAPPPWAAWDEYPVAVDLPVTSMPPAAVDGLNATTSVPPGDDNLEDILLDSLSLDGHDGDDDADSVLSDDTEVPSQPFNRPGTFVLTPSATPRQRVDSFASPKTERKLEVRPAEEDITMTGAIRSEQAPDFLPLPLSQSDLHDAVRHDDVARVRLLLQGGADLESRSEVGMTALHIAASRGHARMVSELLDQGADEDATMYSSLVFPVGKGLFPDTMSLTRPTALHIAACRDDTCVVRLLRPPPSQCPSCSTESPSRTGDSHTMSSDTMTPLVVAAVLGLSRTARILAQGASRKDLTDALVYASMRGDGDIALLLLGRGADPNRPVNGLELHGLEASSNTSRSPSSSLLSLAAERGHFDVVGNLLFFKARTDLEPRTDDGFTPLLAAVRSGNLAAATVLCANGAAVDNHNPAHPGPLSVACERGDVAMAGLLIARGANVNLRNAGLTPLAAAALTGPEALVRLLLGHGADVNPPSSSPDDKVPLMAAIESGRTGVMDILLEHGAEVGPKWSSGPGSLYDENDPELVKLLFGEVIFLDRGG